MKWPKTLGDRDRAKQHEAFVKPVSAEEKIMLTQNAHYKTQKALKKARRNIEDAITSYFKAQYGAKGVIGKLDELRITLLDLQEEIKERTMNALPYKDLNLERINEELFMLPLKRISIKGIFYLFLLIVNMLVYISAFMTNTSWLFVIGIFLSVGIVLSWFILWSKYSESGLFKSSKIGPKN
jgi:hypothetical protein